MEKQRSKLLVMEPISDNLQQFIDNATKYSEQDNFEIIVVKDPEEFQQVVQDAGPSLTIISSPKTCVNILKSNWKTLKELHSKMIMLSPRRLPPATVRKLNALGMTDYVEEPINVKALVHKARLLVRTLPSSKSKTNDNMMEQASSSSYSPAQQQRPKQKYNSKSGPENEQSDLVLRNMTADHSLGGINQNKPRLSPNDNHTNHDSSQVKLRSNNSKPGIDEPATIEYDQQELAIENNKSMDLPEQMIDLIVDGDESTQSSDNSDQKKEATTKEQGKTNSSSHSQIEDKIDQESKPSPKSLFEEEVPDDDPLNLDAVDDAEMDKIADRITDQMISNWEQFENKENTSQQLVATAQHKLEQQRQQKLMASKPHKTTSLAEKANALSNFAPSTPDEIEREKAFLQEIAAEELPDNVHQLPTSSSPVAKNEITNLIKDVAAQEDKELHLLQEQQQQQQLKVALRLIPGTPGIESLMNNSDPLTIKRMQRNTEQELNKSQERAKNSTIFPESGVLGQLIALHRLYSDPKIDVPALLHHVAESVQDLSDGITIFVERSISDDSENLWPELFNGFDQLTLAKEDGNEEFRQKSWDQSSASILGQLEQLTEPRWQNSKTNRLLFPFKRGEKIWGAAITLFPSSISKEQSEQVKALLDSALGIIIPINHQSTDSLQTEANRPRLSLVGADDSAPVGKKSSPFSSIFSFTKNIFTRLAG
ncbi:MAG: hypothetical protein HN353_00385 [Bdellovibrionales bacterium]|jgi:hypothetical protein|nr:hypothetical protein [Bdellovibrionales bacterium]MBT3526409.1 hypothetical protein [Bdellovibrionales bacterium]MBT7669377.1 hypothetical protein [Bdellovibrionales bacterium]MBT7768129.1 hypothetical protein [Bdellovibrionales bacterium]